MCLTESLEVLDRRHLRERSLEETSHHGHHYMQPNGDNQADLSLFDSDRSLDKELNGDSVDLTGKKIDRVEGKINSTDKLYMANTL